MKRIIIVLLTSIVISIISIQFVSAGPLSKEQINLFRSGVKYFDIIERTPYRPTPGGGGGGTGTGQWAWPVSGHPIGGGPGFNPSDPSCYRWGHRENPPCFRTGHHAGIDIPAPEGTNVYAVDDGFVSFTGDSGDGYGNRVTINHGNGLSSFYAHLSRIDVSSGQPVTRGSTIVGGVGNTGASGGNHLHLGVKPDQDPCPLLGGC